MELHHEITVLNTEKKNIFSLNYPGKTEKTTMFVLEIDL